MKLTNLDLIYFCQNLLGAPYWFNASAIKATKHAYKINSMRFPEEYSKREPEFYEQAISDYEVVTDSIGLIKGFMWSDGGEVIIANRGNEIVHNYKPDTNGCPDKSVNGMFIWATTQDISWGNIDTLPEIPGIIVTTHGRLGIYEGNGYVIEANKDKGCVTREPLDSVGWRFWYELPFIEYTEQIKIVDKDEIQENKPVELSGLAIAIKDALAREGCYEDSKFLRIIPEKEQILTYNDSNLKMLHYKAEEEEGYVPASLFIYFPEKPHVMSNEAPQEFDNNLIGDYIIQNNTRLQNKAAVRSNSYAVLPKGHEVRTTGGYTNEWYQVYTTYNNKIYVGYIDKKKLKRTVIIEQ